jgi:hypothetical protein
MDHPSQSDDSPIELETLRSARTDPVPDASIVDAHREGLATAVRHERISPRNRQALRRVAMVAAAIPALAGSALLVSRTSGPDGDDLGDVELAASSAFYDAPRCGSAPPPDVNIPDAFSGPIDGPSPDSDRPTTADQLIRHWTSPTSSIELRWYADSDATPPAFAEGKATVDDAGAASDPSPHPVADGVADVVVTLGRSAAASERRYGGVVYGTEAGEPDDPCTWAQVTVFDNDPEQVNETLDKATRLCEGDVDVLEVQVLASPTWDERDNGRSFSMPDLWDDCDD